jgi:hypothetical protein
MGIPQQHGPARSPGSILPFFKTLHVLHFDDDLERRVVPHFFQTPRTHNLCTTLVPAVKELAKWLGDTAMQTPRFVRLRQGCVDRLERGSVQAHGWEMPAGSTCDCTECKQLIAFCLNPDATEMRLDAALEVKLHVAEMVER